MTSYMVIEQTQAPEEWEEKMVAYVSLENVLFGKCICEDGESNLWYDITAKQSLEALLEEQKIDYNLLCLILIGLYEVTEKLDEILLNTEGILLMQESIFFDYEQKNVYFCYCHENMPSIRERFLCLMEYLLKKLDHDDVRAVELAYEIYGQAAKSGWSLQEIKGEVRLSYHPDEMTEDALVMEEEVKGIDESKVSIVDQVLCVKRERRKYVECIKKFLCKIIPGIDYGECRNGNKFKVCNMQDVLAKADRLRGKGMEKKEQERFVFQPDEEESELKFRPTVLLEELTKAPEGILRYEGNGACSDLTITGEEYLIGSDKACVGYIPSKTVSRRHAKIIQADDIYFIEDLNSSNGTYVGGKLLNYRTKVSLQKNEIIIFADEKFRFI